MGSGREVIVFARVPRLGEVKTRLARAVGEGEALRVHRLLLARALAVSADANASVQLCVTGDDALGECAELARAHGAALSWQSGAALGERMERALALALARRARVVLIGCDCPSLQTRDLDDALDALDEVDAVFAPAADGGYALVGASRPIPDAFSGIGWGGERVMHDTRRRMREARLRWHELRPQWDVDDLDGYQRWLDEGGAPPLCPMLGA